MSKTYVIGDLHGCYDEFIELTKQIGITDDDLIISLGDIVDRGNKSVELYDYFKNRKNSIVLMGNHERKHLNGILNYSQEIVKVQFQDKYNEFLEWLKTLPYFYETDTAIIVHAFFEHDKTLQEQKEEVLAGTTSGSKYLEEKYEEGKYWSDYYEGNKPVIYGHHVVGESPKVKNNTYGIDTGACHGGMLTAIELPSFTIHQIAVKTDYWKDEQSKWQIPVLEAKDWENMKISHIYNQIEKLEYKEEQEVKDFLEHQKNWMNEVEKLTVEIKTKIEKIAAELSLKHSDNFNQEVAKLKYSVFIFKSKSNNLTIDYLKKNLDTPQKVIDLARELSIQEVLIKKANR
jgi:serine/threonine protein phosphatase 1